MSTVFRFGSFVLGGLLLVGTASWAAPAVAQTAAEGEDDGSLAEADATDTNPLTVENLIGNAVSLSNKQYPDVESAIQRFRNGDGEGAYDYLKLAYEKSPNLPPPEVILAKMQLLARNTAGAAQLLERAVVEHPEDPEAYLLLADQAFGGGRTAEAEALFDKAAGLVEPFSANAKRKRDFQIRVIAGNSAVCERRQQWDAAMKLLQEWVKLDPDSAPAHQRLGVVLFRSGKPDEAYKEFAEVREINPDANHPSVFMGQLFNQADEKDKARAAFEKAYKAEPDNDNTAAAFAEWLVTQNDLETAQKVATALRSKNPESVGALLLDGVVAKLRNEPKQAEEALMKVLSVDPSNARATDLLALILIDSSKSADKEKALRYAQVNAQRFPNNAQANITLAWVLFQLDRGREASEALQRGAQASGGQLNADSAFLVARIMLKQNQTEKAISTLKQLLEQQNSGPFLYRNEAAKLLKQLEGGAE
ncbi:MAG: tetratricopeptide repeat protein [Planctomycetales bacterium]|nr:tetratricopeptide repeat protein [Planctomycetales bacterium]